MADGTEVPPDRLGSLRLAEGGATGVEDVGIADWVDDAAAERLEARVRASSIEVVTVGDDHRLRSLDAGVDFGTEVPEGLEEVLGPYAAARLELRLALS